MGELDKLVAFDTHMTCGWSIGLWKMRCCVEILFHSCDSATINLSLENRLSLLKHGWLIPFFWHLRQLQFLFFESRLLDRTSIIIDCGWRHNDTCVIIGDSYIKIWLSSILWFSELAKSQVCQCLECLVLTILEIPWTTDIFLIG